MKREFSLSEISEWISADKKIFGTASCVVTDSRKIVPGCLFVALEGERFDGHTYLAQALEKGAAAAVAHKHGQFPEEKTLFVGDTQRAYRGIARLHRIHEAPRVVAVTGSVGKTSTKDMIAAVLSSELRTLKTEANLNNQFGVPQTLLGLDGHEAAVIEMAMTAPGEIEELSLTVLPEVGVVTNIGVSHMERLGSRDNIFRAKMEILAGLREDSPLILNGDSDYLDRYEKPKYKIIRYGLENTACDVTAREIEERGNATSFTLCCGAGQFLVTIPVVGRHNVLNALAAWTAGSCFGLSPDHMTKALGAFSPSGMRQKMVPWRQSTVVEDCYNAGPESMEAAITTLMGRPTTGKRYLALADMLELGELSIPAHQKVGRRAAQLGADGLFTTGEMGRVMAEAAREAGAKNVRHFETKDEMAVFLANTLSPGDILWVKGSHGMALETMLAALYARE
ncbi:MAG: UDP-N-acetylmuramoyl-tripeptide--D-alanyl-D-alanine ligase [Oscillospiraceae bacterium]|nr:UDP-N-acetylmuramoyl-tripeptide--D-alanyl-D-alanine ligase [Oscillospiraceae bacterium]